VRWRKAGPPRDTDTDTFAGNETVVTAKLGETKTMPTGGGLGQNPEERKTRGGKLQTDCDFIFCLRGRKSVGKPQE